MKISLAINSKNPVPEYLAKLLITSRGFDERVIYIDGIDTSAFSPDEDELTVVGDGVERDIKDGFNYVVGKTTGDWVCPFCDDDYFIDGNLSILLRRMREESFGIYADIIHFPVMTASGPWGTDFDFELWEIESNNMIPHGCFIRREAFDQLGGYKINAGADWNLWVRAKRAGLRFRGFSLPVYFFRQGTERSAWSKQVREMGCEKIRAEVLANA